MNKNGVIYYKLISSYGGDITKNCGLTGGEIDGNFLFLRGYDIENGSWDNENKVLSFTRINGEKIVVDGFNFEPNVENSYYDSKNGELVLNVNGNEHRISGFYVNKNTESTETIIYTDSTIEGDGSVNSPLSINDLTKTGFYSTIKAYVNICNDEILPSNPKLGDKYLTKEPVSNYGLLYNFDGVKAVQQILNEEGSSWHIPTNKEWGEMLNALELCDEDRTHLGQLSNRYYGKNAGDILKADTYEWMHVSTTSVSGKDCLTTEDNILPTASQEKYEETFLGGVKYEISGISEDDSVVYHQYICKSSWDEDESNAGKSSVSQGTLFKALPVGTTSHLNRNNIQSIGKLVGYWTIDQDGETDAWARVLEYNTGKVRQQSESTDSYYSLRLVRDYKNDAKGVEMINGLPYNTILMPYVEVDENGTIIKQGTRVWTAENVSFIELLDKDGEYQALKVTDNNNEISLDGRFFLNKWNGEEWEKLLLDDNTLLILNEGPDKSINEEWRINKGEIRKRITEIANKVTKEMSEVIDGISENHIKDIEKLNENVLSLKYKLDTNITIFTDSDNTLTDKINEVERKVDEEVLGRTNAYTELRESLEGIKKDFDSSLSGNVDELNANLSKLEKTLISKIENEDETRISKDEELQKLIDDNKTIVNEQISEINGKINSVNTSVSTSHETLNTKIENVDRKLVGEFAALSGKVDENTSKLNDVISEINTRINTESFDRIAADTAIEESLNTTIENVCSSLTEKISVNTTEIDNTKRLLDNEAKNREAEDNSIRETISSLDTKLSNQIESTKCDVKSYVDDKVSESYAELDKKISDEKNERKEEDTSIRKLVNDKFNEVKNSIEEEIKNREDKDKELFEDINTKYSEFCDLIDGINDNVNVAKGDISIIKSDVEYIEGEIRGIKQQQEGENSSLRIEIDDIDGRLVDVEKSYATKGELLSESNRAKSVESKINENIGRGFDGKTITKAIEELLDKNERDFAEFTKAIGENAENIKDLDDIINVFLNDLDASSTIDTLREIQDFITDNGKEAEDLLNKINQIEKAADNAQKAADNAQDVVNSIEADYLKSSDKYELSTKIENNKNDWEEEVIKINNEFGNVRNEFANADNVLKVELKNGYEVADEKLKGEIIAQITELRGEVDSINDINNDITNLNKEITSLKTKDDQLSSDIKNLNNKGASYENNITALSGSVSNISSSVSEIKEEIRDIKTINGDISDISNKINTINKDINTINNNINTIDGKINSIEDDIDDINIENINLGNKIDNEIERAKNAENDLRALILSSGNNNSGSGTTPDVSSQIQAVVNTLDYSDIAETNKIITEIDQTNGVINVKRTSFSNAGLVGKDEFVSEITRLEDIINGGGASGGGGSVSGDYIPTTAITTGTVSDNSDKNLVASASHNHDGSPVYTSTIKIISGGTEFDLIQKILELEKKVEELSAMNGISDATNITSKNIGGFAVTSLTSKTDDIIISGKTGDIKIDMLDISDVLLGDAKDI